MSENETIAVEKDILEALLKIARAGERQEVRFDFDNSVMAKRAALLSKDMCSRSVEILHAILTDQKPKVERFFLN